MAEQYRELLVALTGGLNTSSDPAELSADELVESVSMEYRPPNIGLFAVGGRSRFDSGGTLGGTKVQGLVYAGFDTTATSVTGPRLIAFSGTSAFGATVTGTNSFATVKRDLTETNYADGCHYGNDWFFWNGTDASWSLRGINLQASARHGMTSGTWTVTAFATSDGVSTNTIGTFQLWNTEYDASLVSGTGLVGYTEYPPLEGAFNGTVGTVNLSATGMFIRYQNPATSNDGGAGNNLILRHYITIAGGRYPFGFAFNSDEQATGVIGLGALRGILPFDASSIGRVPYQVTSPHGGIAVSSNSQPPNPFSMTIFQDSAVAIDRDDRQLIKYSSADAPHSFPSTYFIPFETEQQDDLTALAVCNDSLLVFSSVYGYRVEDLPRAEDGENIFASRSRAKVRFSSGHGCVSPRGVAAFTIFGSGDLCLFVCRDGIHVTDGYKTDYASDKLDWLATVDLASLSRSVLKNNSKKHRIEFYYADATTPTSWKRLDFYYYPSLLKQSNGGFPKFPILGPTDVPGPAAAFGVLGSDWQMWTGHDAAGSVWTEATGTDDGANLIDGSGTINKSWKTKTWYPAGFNGETELLNVYTHQSQTTASGSYTITGTFGVDDEQSPFTATATVTQSYKGAMPHPELINRSGWFNLRGAKNDDGAWQEMNSITFIVQNPRRIESGKSSV